MSSTNLKSEEFKNATENEQEDFLKSHLTKILLSNDKDSVQRILPELQPFFVNLPKARTTKIIKKLLILSKDVRCNAETHLLFCECLENWCKEKKRSFLLQRVQTHKAQLFLDQKRYREVVVLARKLAEEAKRVDDKFALVEAMLLDSRVNSLLGNIPVAKSSLIASRTAATTIFIQPRLQAELDLQAGDVALSDRDYKSAYSYYYESFEGFDGLKDETNALRPLKYMLLCKMLSDRPQEIEKLIENKSFRKYKCEELELISKMAAAYSKRDLKAFKSVISQNETNLKTDALIAKNISEVSLSLLENSIKRVVEPYTKVEISWISQQLEMDQNDTEKTIARMILDQKIEGMIDQQRGHLTIYKKPESNNLIETTLMIISELQTTVKKLEERINVEEE